MLEKSVISPQPIKAHHAPDMGAWCQCQSFAGEMRGFTMIELVVVIILIGVLSATAMSRMSLLTGYDEVAYRDSLKSTLEYARRTAVASRRVVCATVSGNALTLRIEETIPETAGSGTCSGGGITAHDLALPVPDSHCSGVANGTCPPPGVTLADASLGFNGLGQPLSGAGALLGGLTTWTITNTKTGGTTTLNIAADSGYVY